MRARGCVPCSGTYANYSDNVDLLLILIVSSCNGSEATAFTSKPAYIILAGLPNDTNTSLKHGQQQRRVSNIFMGCMTREKRVGGSNVNFVMNFIECEQA